MSEITPSQTIGPFFAYGLTPTGRAHWDPNGQYSWKQTIGDNLVTPDVSGDRVMIEGQVLDGDGQPIPDAMLEIWQADAQGRYASAQDTRERPNAAFKGHGRSATDKDGRYEFSTIRPGPVPGLNGQMQAPHILVAFFSRGMLRQIYTRVYFADEKANATDAVLAMVPQERRATLIATPKSGAKPPTFVFDIRLQGDGETVFFEI